MTKRQAKNLRAGDRVRYEDGLGATVKAVSTYGSGYITLLCDDGTEAIVATMDAAESLALIPSSVTPPR